MKIFKISILIASLIWFFSQRSHAQSLELIGGNIVNGAVTGTILGTAVMGLQDSNDFAPFRIGLGTGILAGSGLAIYDVATLPRGQQFFKSGVFNDGNNSSIIVLLDTVYGAGLGAALGSAIVLIGNESFVDGLQYGASVGAWVGFGFGIVDSFILAEGNRDLVSGRLLSGSGLFNVSKESTQFELIKPVLIETKAIHNGDLRQNLNPALTLFSMRHTF
jgi:hypothetical protein